MSVTYQSTRGGETDRSFEHVLLSAYAKDGGMFVPEQLPTIPVAELRTWARLSFPNVCGRVISLFTGLDVATSCRLTAAAFQDFNKGGPPLPLQLVNGNVLLDTGLGPTHAFKDIGQQVVAQLLNHFLGIRGTKANIIVETSGDTGPAAVAGVQGCPHVEIFCLYPHNRVSPVQELQLTTVAAPNVHVYRTEGNTDEQAEVLKSIFMDEAFMRENSVCSINSINWARIAAQSSYYVWATLQMSPDLMEPVNFVVPTGAFGNAMGGFLAKKMGVPIGTIVCATNANDMVHRCISAGRLGMGTNVQTVSPAMDIQFAYNLERLLFYTTGQDSAKVAKYMSAMEASSGDGAGIMIDDAVMAEIRKTFVSCSVSDKMTLQTMRETYEQSGCKPSQLHASILRVYLGRPAVILPCGLFNMLCPHSACAVYAAGTVAKALRGPQVCVLTAHPAKFEEAVKEATGVDPVMTANVEALKRLPADRFEWLRRSGPNWRTDWEAQIKAAVRRANAPKARL